MKKCIVTVVALLAIVIPAYAQDGAVLLRSTLTGDISNLNPIFSSDSASIDVGSFLWRGLFETDPQTALPIPDLATWGISEDGMTYTFSIRDDANWSDGMPITSADVDFAYRAISAPDIPSPRKGNVALIDSINIIDDKTFEVVLSAPNCTVWGNTFGALTPIPSHVFAADFSDLAENDFNTEPNVTSGPYFVDEWEPDEFIRLQENPDFYGGDPQIPSIFNRVLVDTTIQNQSLLTGEVDYVFMYPDQLEQLGGPDFLIPHVFSLNNTPMLIMNWADSANPQSAYDEEGNLIEQDPNRFFSDARVRQAVAMGYDKNAVLQTLGPGGGARAAGPVTPSFGWAVAEELTGYEYNPERAAELLDEAGWIMNEETGIREKDGLPFEVDLLYAELVDLYTNIALIAQDQLGDIGIKLNVSIMEWSAYLTDVLLSQKFDITIVGFGGGTEVDGIAYNILLSENDVAGSGFNLTSYINPRVDELLKEGRTLAGCDADTRAEIYRELQQIVFEEVAYDFTVVTNQVHVMNSRVTNFNPGPWNSAWQIPSWGITDG